MNVETESKVAELWMPPGGLLVWLFIVLELFTFGMGFIAYVIARKRDPALFAQGQAQLSLSFAVANTALLLTSGYCVAQAVNRYHRRMLRAASQWTFAGAALGVGFLILKSIEYRDKIDAGHTIESNDFYAYYWALTGFHFLHVAIGVAMLLAVAAHLARQKRFASEDGGLDAVAAFWHMCDLIWIVLFPLLYVLRGG
jgi:nitric oxide reductase NorE protein